MIVSRWRNSPRLAAWLAIGVGIAILLLTALAVRASRKGQQSSVLLVQRRVDEAARLLVTALARDMRAVQSAVLMSSTWDALSPEWPHDITTLVASAFARYPYPECFLAWRPDQPPNALIFLTRSARPPAWMHSAREPNRYPVRLATHEPTARRLLDRILADASAGRQWSMSEQAIDGTTYQVIIRLRYRDARRQQLAAVYGFMVNVAWVRQHYFPEITRQMARIHRDDPGLLWGVLDDEQVPVVSTGGPLNTALASGQPFPFTFFDASTVALNPPQELPIRQWSVIVSGAADPALAAAALSAHTTLWLVALAAMALVVGLALTASAVRARGELAEFRAEFMSSVTHELKTPIATICVLGDTMRHGRIPTAAAQREYASLIVQEAQRLARLVDNLLAHARVTDVAEVYSFESVHADELIQSVLASSRQRLAHGAFDVTVEIAPDLAPLWADRTAMQLALDNLVDNAIRYSDATRSLRITARAQGDEVQIVIADRGIGIPPQDIDRVTHKFVRGPNVPAGGSGLGLSIVTRIVNDHHGSFGIESELGVGTTVTLRLPIDNDAAHTAGRGRPIPMVHLSGSLRTL